MESDTGSLNDRLKIIEDLIESGTLSKETYDKEKKITSPHPSAEEKDREKTATKTAMELPKAAKEDLANIGSLWNEISRQMPEMFTACLRTATPAVRPEDGKLMIRFEDDTVMCLCDDESFSESLNEAFEKVIGKRVEYELVSLRSAADNGEYFPPVSIFGMEVDIDDSDFE